MALIDLTKVSKTYATKTLLHEASLHIDAGDRLALIGQNGSGKSTLINIIRSIIDPDDGQVITQNAIKINYLDQNPNFNQDITVGAYLEEALSFLKATKDSFDASSKALQEDFENEKLLSENAKLASILDFYNGWDLTRRLNDVITQFSLDTYKATSIQNLSGGEKRRVALAALLLQESDVLILDEPTNHLDVYMVAFLEEILTQSRYTLLFVSHDRYFIDNVASKVIELDGGKLTTFAGGYTKYLMQKEALLKQKEKENETLLKLLKNEEEWLAKGVQGRRKRNEGRKANLMQLREECKKNPSQIRKMAIELEREKKTFQNSPDKKSKRKVFFEIQNLSLSVGDKLLFEDFTTRILQKDKIAIVGKNGTGKSTLLKTLLATIKTSGQTCDATSKGHIKVGEFSIGYFDQNKNGLDDNKTLLETFCPHGGDRIEVQGHNMHVYGYLKNFLFPKEFLSHKIGLLSGGEKTRVALALLMAQNKDVLILDEPTNDLDIQTINILEQALMQFAGALIFVSHDRYFVDKIANKLLIISGQKIEESALGYSEYLDIEKTLNAINDLANNPPPSKKERAIPKPVVSKKKLTYKEKIEYEQLEQEIPHLEQEIATINACLSDPDCYQEKGLNQLSQTLTTLNIDYDAKVERFLYLCEYI